MVVEEPAFTTKAEAKITSFNSLNKSERCSRSSEETSSQIPTSLGLIDGMSKFFTPISTQRHHETNFANFLKATSNAKFSSGNPKSPQMLMARKILRRTRHAANSRPNRASSLPKQFKVIRCDEKPATGGCANLNSSDKENQHQTKKNLSLSFSPTLKSPTITFRKSPVLISSKLAKQRLQFKQKSSRKLMGIFI